MDILGNAISDFFHHGSDIPVRIWINNDEDESLYPSSFFRNVEKMSEIEKFALDLCAGKVLDVGAGAGCHSLALQSRGIAVTSIDNSKLSCEVMEKQGLKHVINEDIMQFEGDKFDAILLLMNGFGLARNEDNLQGFVSHLVSLLNPGGFIIGESTDILYMFENQILGVEMDLARGYYGEVEFQLRSRHGETRFDWIYPDEYMLEDIALSLGLSFEMITRGERHNFLCRIGLPALAV